MQRAAHRPGLDHRRVLEGASHRSRLLGRQANGDRHLRCGGDLGLHAAQPSDDVDRGLGGGQEVLAAQPPGQDLVPGQPGGHSGTAGDTRLDADAAVVVQRPTRVVGHFPDIPVRVGKGPGRASPFGSGGCTHDRCAGPFGGHQHSADLLGRADVVGQFDAGRSMTAERCPQTQHHPASLKEADLVVWLVGAAPTQRLVEPAGAAEVGDAEGHEADALLDSVRIVLAKAGPEAQRRASAGPGRSAAASPVTRSARNASQVRRPTARWGARLAPARNARAALPGSQIGMTGRRR
jgi:hypothetical protein